MLGLALGLLVVPLLDQAVKALMVRGLTTPVPLGPFGKLQVIRSRIWLARAGLGRNLAVLWALWFLAAATLAVVVAFFPSCGWFAGALIGGSLSHALETSLRGSIVDYVCLRFWPALNLADGAITVGALGILVQMVLMATEAWP
jgi:signal peptidase II